MTILTDPAHVSEPIIRLRGIGKKFASPAGEFHALSDVDLCIERGEFVAIVGQSGSGKSTLLNLLAGLDRPSSGELFVDNANLCAMSQRNMSAWRGVHVGIVFQFFQLLPTLTAAENVMLPMDFVRRWPRNERRPRALALLERLDIAEQANKLPAALSGGQQQRVAVARALANSPALLLADEPTGNLDSRTAQSLLDVFAALSAEGQTVVMVTHDAAAIGRATRAVTLADGRVLGAAHAHA